MRLGWFGLVRLGRLGRLGVVRGMGKGLARGLSDGRTVGGGVRGGGDSCGQRHISRPPFARGFALTSTNDESGEDEFHEAHHFYVVPTDGCRQVSLNDVWMCESRRGWY